MGDNVIEFAQAGRLHHVELAQRDVAQPESAYGVEALLDCALCEINAGECALWQRQRQRDEIRAIAASQFENAAAIRWSGRHPEQSSYDSEAIGMGLR